MEEHRSLFTAWLILPKRKSTLIHSDLELSYKACSRELGVNDLILSQLSSVSFKTTPPMLQNA